jgi:hypothetical protein
MNPISKNKWLEAIKNLLLFSAIIHVFLLILYSIRNWNAKPLNYFNILDLDLFFPKIADGFLSTMLSIIFVIIIYFTFYFISSRKVN